MNRLNVEVVYNNDRRIFSVNHSLKLADVAKRCLNTFDLNVRDISGIHFFFVDANVYFCSNEDVQLDTSVHKFLDIYGPNFPIITITDINNEHTTQFWEDYENYFQQNSAQTFMFRPTINVTYSQPSSVAMEFEYNPQTGRFQSAQNQNNQPQQNAGQFSDIFMNLGTNILNNLNNRRNNQASQFDMFYNMYTPPRTTQNVWSSLFEQVLNNDGQRLVCRQADIDNLRRGSYGDMRNNGYILQECTQCTITLEDFTTDTQVVVLPCRHGFKERGIINWLRNCSNKCPTCRREVAAGVAQGFI